MYIKYLDDSPEGKIRAAKIKEILPERTLVETMLMPRVYVMYPLLTKMLYAELEIYRAYPKKPLDEAGKVKAEIKTFDARNHTTCFQGKAFTVQDHTFGGADLRDYRNAVARSIMLNGGNPHSWRYGGGGGDHMKDYPEMVIQAFKYGANLIDTRPVLKFHINPLFMNGESGRTKLTKDQKIYKYDEDLLLAKAMTWGVRTQKEADKAEIARSNRSVKQQDKLDKEYLERRKQSIGG